MEHKTINGTRFEAMVKNGLACLRQNETEVNRLNVFPVADGDTGTNMCLTLENGIAYARSEENIGAYLEQLSEGMLLGARGNSGVILSQFFKGVYLSLAGKAEAEVSDLAAALRGGRDSAYSAVVTPVEGTILTVVREGIEKADNGADNGSAEELLVRYIAQMKDTLSRTPEMLDVLRESGVIDSGGQGFIYIVEGMLASLNGRQLSAETAEPQSRRVDYSSFNEFSAFEEGYCTEFILQRLINSGYEQNFSLEEYISALGELGNSLVVVGDGSRVKVHIHTHSPEHVIALSRRYGEFLTFKLENMQLQHNEVLRDKEKEKKLPHKELAMVAVVNGDGLKTLFEELGCDVVIRCGDTMNASTQEFLDAFGRIDADAVVVFPNNKNVILAAEQAVELSGADNITVLPTASIAEGYFSIAMDVPENDADYRISSMRSGIDNITTLSSTVASRDYSFNGLSCSEGEEIVLMNGEVVSAGGDRCDCVLDALAQVPDIEDMETCVIFGGDGVGEEDVERLCERLEEEYPLLETEFIEGGQRFYRFIIGIS